eukprot:12670721-Alexandrium_andersonii.AAC.1
MSASLVGSEMCIRDRLRKAAPQVRRAAPQSSTAEQLLRANLTSSSSTTVSYTHLTLPTICSV